jgi:tetratricopeptide (TPR) repeat protein
VNRIKNLIAGNFLSAKTILDVLIDAEPTNPVLYEYPGKLPPALCRIYEKMFRGRFPDSAIYSNEFAPLVACLASSRKPVPESILISACGPGQRSVVRRLRILSQFLTRTEDNFSFFHLSLVQWLTNDLVQNPFAVSTHEGCRRLAEACLQDIREKGGVISDFTRENLPYYLAGAKMFDVLEENLRDARFIEGIANKGREEFMEVWSYVEQSSPLRIRAVYAPVIESPYGYDPSVLGHMAALLEKRGHHDGALALYRERGQIYQKQKDIQGLQESLWNQGHTLHLMGDEDRSMALFKEQEQICRMYGLHHGLQRALEGQATVHLDRGNHAEALILYRQQERICQRYQLNEGLQNALANQACLLRDRGELVEAMALFEKQEEICRRHELHDGLQFTLGAQWDLLKDHMNRCFAESLFREQVEICRKFGLKESLQNALWRWAIRLQDQDNLTGALLLFREQEQICRKLGLMNGLQFSLGWQASILQKRGDFERALVHLKEQEQICKEKGLKYELQHLLGRLAYNFLQLGNPDNAIAFLKEQEQVCREEEFWDVLAISLKNQAEVVRHVNHNDLEPAVALFEEAYRIAMDCGSVTFAAEINNKLEQIRNSPAKDP